MVACQFVLDQIHLYRTLHAEPLLRVEKMCWDLVRLVVEEVILLPVVMTNEVPGLGYQVRMQVPLQPGWASTLHKSQGQIVLITDYRELYIGWHKGWPYGTNADHSLAEVWTIPPAL